MAERTRTSALYVALKERQSKLQTDLRRLANVKYVGIRLESSSMLDGVPQTIVRGEVRIRKTDFHLRIWEDFRDLDDHPVLYGFRYSLGSADPGEEPYFRYECHPEVEDPDPGANPEGEENHVKWRNEYTFNPHFHPHEPMRFPIDRLHFLFHRSERRQVVFALIAWLEVDLVKRFYDSGRIAAV